MTAVSADQLVPELLSTSCSCPECPPASQLSTVSLIMCFQPPPFTSWMSSSLRTPRSMALAQPSPDVMQRYTMLYRSSSPAVQAVRQALRSTTAGSKKEAMACWHRGHCKQVGSPKGAKWAGDTTEGCGHPPLVETAFSTSLAWSRVSAATQGRGPPAAPCPDPLPPLPCPCMCTASATARSMYAAGWVSLRRRKSR